MTTININEEGFDSERNIVPTIPDKNQYYVPIVSNRQAFPTAEEVHVMQESHVEEKFLPPFNEEQYTRFLEYIQITFLSFLNHWNKSVILTGDYYCLHLEHQREIEKRISLFFASKGYRFTSFETKAKSPWSFYWMVSWP